MKNVPLSRKNYDAVIVGARCAGSATALLLARAGARVLLVDRDLPTNDTLSTHALMRPAVMLLGQWGLLDRIRAAGTPDVRRTSFHYARERISLPIKPEGEVTSLVAPRRGVLDGILADAAVAAGAELRTGVTFEGTLTDTNGRVLGARLRAPDGSVTEVSGDILVGADGRNSAVARAVGAATIVEAQERSALMYGYFAEIPDDGYRWYFGNTGYAGAIPTNDGVHCVFAGMRPEHFRKRVTPDPRAGIAEVIAQCDPELAGLLRSAPQVGHFRKYPGAAGHMRICAGLGWALVGDAGYFKDPSTAHGITDALLDARRLVDAIAASPGHPLEYQSVRDRSSRQFFEITRRIASQQWDLDEVKALLMDLNACMKEEANELRAATQGLRDAA